MIVVVAGEIARELGDEHLARETPVITILVIRLQRAGDEIPFVTGLQQAEAMDERQVAKRADFPVIFAARRDDDDRGLFRVVRRIEFARCEELAVRARHLHHRHDAARAFPDRFLFFAIEAEKIAWVHFLRRAEEMLLSLIGKRREGIAFFEAAEDFFLDL